MSQTEASFSALRQAIRSLWPASESGKVSITEGPDLLLLTLPNDVAAFSVFNSHPAETFKRTYDGFRQLYRKNNLEWDARTLSFVLCRTSEQEEDDRFYASLELDPLFCRKYVIRALADAENQREELLRLPFLPLSGANGAELQRPQSAQDLLQAAGLSASLARNLVEAGVRSAERIAVDLREGKESLPSAIVSPRADRMSLSPPRAHSRLVSMTVEGFRVYRDKQTFSLDAPVVVLYGPNGLGKTSLFDAIDYASTGRIGRLCSNQKRSPTEFARLATHLDKTPGTGSVRLEVRGEEANPTAVWKLERSTGDWSNAWINGNKADRKTVIGRLTQANWLDNAPRQQAYENLFRATHLFGQDEQELLEAFKKGSVIPEAFISEMLALQDYSQGISKVADVLSQLTSHRAETERELEKLRFDARALEDSIAELGPHVQTEPMPIESALDDLRKELATLGFTRGLPPDSPTVPGFSEWQEILSGEGDAAKGLIQEVQKLEAELPTYLRLQEEAVGVQAGLKTVESESESVTTTEKDNAARLETNAKAISEAEGRQKQREQRRQALRIGSEALAEREVLSNQMTALTAERDRQTLNRSEADAKVASIEADLSKALGSTSEIAHSGTALNAEVTKIQGLLREFPRFEADATTLADVRSRLEDARLRLRNAEDRQNLAAEKLRSATALREAAVPKYERALAQQAELETLLDNIQLHVHEPSCPLCGSEFDSVEALLAEIRRKRAATRTATDVTVKYKMLEASETEAKDALRVITAEVAAATSTIQELTTLQVSAEQRLKDFRQRLSVAVPATQEAGARQELTAVLQRLEKQRADNQASLGEANARLKSVQESKAEESAKRNSINERIISLDRNLQEIKDRIGNLNAKVSHTHSEELKAKADFDSAIAHEDRAVQEELLAIEQLRAARRDELSKRETITGQKLAIDERRRQFMAELSAIQRSTTDFELRLRKLDPSDTVSIASLVKIREQLDDRAKGIRAAIDRSAVILSALKAREARLQLAEKRAQIEKVKSEVANHEATLAHVQNGTSIMTSSERLLKRERQESIEKHIAAYGPMITRIQQRLRSVYGFGGIKLEAQNGEAKVQVEWRNKREVHVPPTDFFSDSQKQILMLSIFLAGGLRQTWSGFAPMLLDDPVAHFDDLNAYGFIEMIRGIVSTLPNEWQFIISTCEERLFNLLRKKFSSPNAIFYEFQGMSDSGPIVERG